MAGVSPCNSSPRARPSDVDRIRYAVEFGEGSLRVAYMLQDMRSKDSPKVLVREGDALYGFSDDVGALSGILGVQYDIPTAIHSVR